MNDITTLSKKICLLSPYFGTFPNYFHLWLESAAKNKNIDFYIISDSNFNYKLDSNIFLIKKSLSEIKNRIEQIIKISVCLDKPYKLCDYRPAYGLIFEDIIKDYDYWGWCDPDIIWGNLNLLLTDDILNNYDVIGGCGQLTIMKNSYLLNHYFLHQDRSIKSFSFLEACKTKRNLIFDEWGAPEIRRKLNIKTTSLYEWLFTNVLDIIPPLYTTSNRPYPLMIRFNSSPLLVEYEEGHIWGYTIVEDKIIKKEYAYCHLQKRKIDLYLKETNHFIIFNELFLPINMKDICIEKLRIMNDEIQNNKATNKSSNKFNRIVSFLKVAKVSLFFRALRLLGYKKKFPYEK